jgi:hypothetical protein
VQLLAASTRRYEAELVQDLLDRDLAAQHVEVDARHDLLA